MQPEREADHSHRKANARHDDATQPNRQLQSHFIDSGLQIVSCCHQPQIQFGLDGIEIGFRHQFSHDEISRRFGMRLRLIVCHSGITKSLRVPKCIECKSQNNLPKPRKRNLR